MFSLELLRKSESAEWQLRDIPWDQIKQGAASDSDRRLARGLALGESNAIAALHLFLNESADNYDFASFAAIWCVQEIKHHTAFRMWLEQQGEFIGFDEVQEMRAPYPNGITPAATIATNMISEMNLTHYYHAASERVDEPVLGQILKLTSQDEGRHATEFTHYAKARLAAHPEEVGSVLETLYIYLADPGRALKHPVSVFKGNNDVDEAFTRLTELSGGDDGKLRKRILTTFSSLTGFPLSDLSSVRRALVKAPGRLDVEGVGK